MATQSDTPVERRPSSRLDAYFHISERGSTVEREVRGGFATFFTMAYIVVLNPLILGGAKDAGGHQLDLGQLTTSTALVAARSPSRPASGSTRWSPSSSPARCPGRTRWAWWCSRAC